MALVIQTGVTMWQRAGRAIVLLAIFAQAVIAIAYGVPGHLSIDSVVQLYEGRTHEFISFHPPMMSLLLGLMDQVVPGAALFVLLNQLLYTTSLLLLLRHFGQSVGVVGGLLAATVLLNPIVAVYTGIVWKDVLFAHLILFGYVCLAVSAWQTTRARLTFAAVAIIAVALAASLRQQGLLLALPAALYVGWSIAAKGYARLTVAAGALSLVLGINALILHGADRVAIRAPESRASTGLLLLARYDLAGILAHGGSLPDPQSDREMRPVVPSYDPYRADGLGWPAQDSGLMKFSYRDAYALWARSILHSPAAYLRHRARHFGFLLGLGDATRCPPLHLGVPAQAVHPELGRELVRELGLTPGVDARAQRMHDWLKPLFDGPLFMHLFYCALTGLATLVLIRRGDNWPFVLFGIGTLVFTASYAVVSIACDFRYIYVLPVTATALLFAQFVGAGARSGASPA
jgi:hypothetical protein